MAWIGSAKYRNQRLGAIAYDQGLLIPRDLDLRNSGYLKRLRLTQTLQPLTPTFASGTAPPLFDFLGQYGGLIKRVTVRTNSVGVLFDCSGEMAAVISAIDGAYSESNFTLQPPPTSIAAASSLLTGVATPIQKWQFDIPIEVQLDNKPWPLGLFQTALNSQETTLELLFRPILSPALNAAAPTVIVPGTGIYVTYTTTPALVTVNAPAGSVDVNQIYFDPIADPKSQPPLSFIHQWREYQMPIQFDGDNDFRIPPSNYYTRLLVWVFLMTPAGTAAIPAPAGTIVKVQLRYGANLAPYDEIYDEIVGRQNRALGFNLPLGLLDLDFLSNARTERDIINSAATTDLRFTITTAVGALASYAGAGGTAFVKVAAEQMIPLVAAAPGTAGVQGAAATAGV